MGWDKKFVPPFIAFVGEHFAIEEHRFIVHGPVMDGHVPQGQSVIHYPHLLKQLLPLVAEMRAARKIIIHGLFSSHLLYLLMLQPCILKKCYWMIWGGDLYVHQDEIKDWRWHKNEWIRRFVISRLGHFITYIKGDYELAQQWYGAKGEWHDCFMYPSNLYKEDKLPIRSHDGVNILLGNSASPTNNHIDALEQLRPFVSENFRIYCPLSYGDENYGKKIAKAGEEIFGEKFFPLRDFMPFDKYLELLSDIDIAVFNHKRQQGMGNIISLLGMGKAVYVRSDITTWQALTSMGLVVGDARSLELQPLPSEAAAANRAIIANRFSESVLINQFRAILED